MAKKIEDNLDISASKYLTENKYPTLYVKNFAKIKEAEIEFAPLTLFVGNNNSGKSYLMALIWGLMDEFKNDIFFRLEDKELFSFTENKNHQSFINIKKIIKDAYNSLERSSDIKKSIYLKDIMSDALILFNEELLKKKDELVKDIFRISNKYIKIGKIELKFNENDFDFSLLLKKDTRPRQTLNNENKDIEIVEEVELIIFSLEHCFSGIGFPITDSPDNMFDKIVSFTIYELFHYVLKTNSIYLPSSRTTFSLLRFDIHKIALQGLLGREKEANNSWASDLKVNKPVNRFIREYSSLDSEEYDPEIDNAILNLIEKEIIHGTVQLNKDTREIKYMPQGSRYDFLPQNTSAVVTELMPLILFMKYNPELLETLFIEEPEISLHPKLQQQIARVLIKMVNNGNRLFITTHSDTILQHINNMIKLAHNPKKKQAELFKKYSYDKDDIIDKDKIRIYQFDVESNNKTVVNRLNCTKYGCEMPTFVDFINDMSSEIEDLLEEI